MNHLEIISEYLEKIYKTPEGVTLNEYEIGLKACSAHALISIAESLEKIADQGYITFQTWNEDDREYNREWITEPSRKDK